MSTLMSDDEIRRLAQRRVAARKGFFGNLATYIVINAMLVVIWAVSGGGYMWFLWVAGGWGVALIFHALSVFVFPKEGGDWEQAQVRKEMDKIRKNQG
jgi:hypothetical protein